MAKEVKSATVQDVARLAGCSAQTVSRVVNGSDRVRSDTRERVLAAIAQLDYHPNLWARKLQGSTVHSIGLSIPFSTEQIRRNPFFAEIISAISNECSRDEMGLSVVSYDETAGGIDLLIRMYRQKVISGLVLTCPGMDPEAILSLKHARIPLVVIGRPPAGVRVNYVDGDNVRAAADSTRYLLQRGHRRIALLNGPSVMTYSDDLYRGYSGAMADYGLPPGVGVETNLLVDDAERKTRDLVVAADGYSGYVAANAHIALGLIQSLRLVGRTVPEDISLVSCSSSEYDEFVTPPITSVRIDYSELGRRATRILLRAMNDPSREPETVVLSGSIVERGSCGPPSDAQPRA